mmetsp:Transcript_11927/g.31152  ORF Transcript_11927/g.31152 Transcript_11927/m.31152 type:complete len:793 (+) Transcript_11927:4262-6640(+)
MLKLMLRGASEPLPASSLPLHAVAVAAVSNRPEELTPSAQRSTAQLVLHLARAAESTGVSVSGGASEALVESLSSLMAADGAGLGEAGQREVGKAVESAAGSIGSALLKGTLPGEPAATISSPRLNVSAHRALPAALEGKAITPPGGAGSLYLPVGLLAPSVHAGEAAGGVDMHLISYGRNVHGEPGSEPGDARWDADGHRGHLRRLTEPGSNDIGSNDIPTNDTALNVTQPVLSAQTLTVSLSASGTGASLKVSNLVNPIVFALRLTVDPTHFRAQAPADFLADVGYQGDGDFTGSPPGARPSADASPRAVAQCVWWDEARLLWSESGCVSLPGPPSERRVARATQQLAVLAAAEKAGASKAGADSEVGDTGEEEDEGGSDGEVLWCACSHLTDFSGISFPHSMSELRDEALSVHVNTFSVSQATQALTHADWEANAEMYMLLMGMTALNAALLLLGCTMDRNNDNKRRKLAASASVYSVTTAAVTAQMVAAWRLKMRNEHTVLAVFMSRKRTFSRAQLVQVFFNVLALELVAECMLYSANPPDASDESQSPANQLANQTLSLLNNSAMAAIDSLAEWGLANQTLASQTRGRGDTQQFIPWLVTSLYCSGVCLPGLLLFKSIWWLREWPLVTRFVKEPSASEKEAAAVVLQGRSRSTATLRDSHAHAAAYHPLDEEGGDENALRRRRLCTLPAAWFDVLAWVLMLLANFLCVCICVVYADVFGRENTTSLLFSWSGAMGQTFLFQEPLWVLLVVGMPHGLRRMAAVPCLGVLLSQLGIFDLEPCIKAIASC